VIANIARDQKTKSAPRRRGDAENSEGREAEKQVSPLINTDDTDRNGHDAKRPNTHAVGSLTLGNALIRLK
jgi:hypothetical protein